MNPTNVANQWIESLVRYVLVGVGAFFVHRGIIDQSLWEGTIPVVVAGAVAAFWSLYRKYQIAEAVHTALAMKAGSTPTQLTDELKKNQLA
jgi:hypothetical protein